ncbi:fungal-specific transcription factor domain-containing protein, partial [Lineolata rhizophorae]
MSPQGPDADDSFFNDLSRQPDRDDGSSASRSNSIDAALPAQNDAAAGATAAAGAVSTTDPAGGTPKLKRIACVLCRKRKLRCDGARPTCGTCKRLSHDCAYDEVRRKSGPKRGYVKQLEARLMSEQVENLLKNQDEHGPDGRESSNPSFSAPSVPQGMGRDVTNLGLGGNPDAIPQIVPPGGLSPEEQMLQGGSGSLEGTSVDGGFPFEMIGLGLQEPLPPADVIDELHHIYFEKVHSSVPMIHRRRYLAAMNLGPNMRPPVCLRYIIWCLAASVSDKYECFQDHFYQRARKYAQIDEMKGHGESTISIAHCQTWVLICSYEFKLMYFPRAWMSTGRAVRLAQMMQLHRLDGQGLDVKQCLPPPKDWTEKEERRRTFWMAYCQDRYASIGTGWPMTIEEKDIMTNLPAIDDAYDKSKPMQTASLEQTFSLSGPSHLSTLSPFGGIVLMATLFGRNLTHLHRPTPNDNDHDIDGEFWKRHRQLDNILMQTTLGLPDHLRLPAGMQDPNVVFMNMSIHTSAICLHQAAIFKADQNHLSPSIGSESKIRCITAAAEITNIMRTIYTQDVAAMNPFVVFCLYVAARVFIQYLRSQPKDQQITSSLQFLLSAMQALKRKNPLSDSFLAQLDVDLEGAGI